MCHKVKPKTLKDIPASDQEALKAQYVQFINLCQKALDINVENSHDPRFVIYLNSLANPALLLKCYHYFSAFTYHKTLRDGCMDIKQQLSELGVQFD